MKNILILIVITSFFNACSEEKKTEETPSEKETINISVDDDSSQATININGNKMNVKSSDGTEASVEVGEDGIDVKSDNGMEATIKVDKEGNAIMKSKEGEASVKVDKSGNMNIKTADGKEVNINVKDAMEQK